MTRAADDYSALLGLAVPVSSPSRASGLCWVHYRVFQVDPSVHIAISIAVTCHPSPSEFPRGSWGPNGLPGRSCFRATPAWSTRSRRGVNVRDALRAVYLTEATEPEHCRRVQIVVGKLPGLPDRTWAFGPWRSSWAWASHREGGDGAPNAGRRPTVVRSGHGSAERWDEIPEPAGCGHVESSVTPQEVGTGMFVYITVFGD